LELLASLVVFALNAGLVAEEKAHTRHLGRISEEDGERGISVEVGVVFLDRVDAVVEEGSLHPREALKAPSGRNDAVNEYGFGFADGRELVAEPGVRRP
jgi:hypothetical protein